MLASVTRTGRLLSLFTTGSPSQGVSEIALALGISKSSAHDLAHSLESIGLLRQGADRRYRLGWRIVRLHRCLLNASELHDAASPVVRAVYRRTGCAVAVVVQAGESADVLLAEGGIEEPSAAAAAMITGGLARVGGPSGVAPIREHDGTVVGVVDVAAGPVAGSTSHVVRRCFAPEHRQRIAQSVAAEICRALRLPESAPPAAVAAGRPAPTAVELLSDVG